MTTKDYVYLSLLALTAVLFYWTGFYGGFNTTLKMLQHKEDEGNGSSDFEVKPLVGAPVSELALTTPPSREVTPAGSAPFPIHGSLFGRN